jgi:hypothetical protein
VVIRGDQLASLGASSETALSVRVVTAPQLGHRYETSHSSGGTGNEDSSRVVPLQA